MRHDVIYLSSAFFFGAAFFGAAFGFAAAFGAAAFLVAVVFVLVLPFEAVEVAFFSVFAELLFAEAVFALISASE